MAPIRAQEGDDARTGCPCVGPSRGTVIIAGGGALPQSVYRGFVERAGGPTARIVVIPTAGEEDLFPTHWSGLDPFHAAGARSVRVLHTRDRAVADDPDFVAPLLEATGVWILGGRQWRLADAYLGTRVQRAIEGVLDRGGVVGGTSAGASVLASYLMRGTPDWREIPTQPGDDVGFGLLEGVAVDQHLIARNREWELVEVIEMYPQLLGIGLDEGTALVIEGDLARVEGASRVAIYDRGGLNHPVPFHWLEPGEAYDLGRRRRVGLFERPTSTAP